MNNNSAIVWVASFDIGKKNFGFYIEEFDSEELSDINNVEKNKRYNSDGTPTEIFDDILKKVYNNGTRILLDNVDLTTDCDKKAYLDPLTFHNMTTLLDKYLDFWGQCDVFIIEKQMGFGKKNYNTMAIKLGQHCWSYFAIKYGSAKMLVEFPAYHKTKILGAQKIKTVTPTGKIKYKAINKNKRKEWSVDKAMCILMERSDHEAVNNIGSVKKKDDLGDVICQLQAFKYLQYVDKSM